MQNVYFSAFSTDASSGLEENLCIRVFHNPFFSSFSMNPHLNCMIYSQTRKCRHLSSSPIGGRCSVGCPFPFRIDYPLLHYTTWICFFQLSPGRFRHRNAGDEYGKIVLQNAGTMSFRAGDVGRRRGNLISWRRSSGAADIRRSVKIRTEEAKTSEDFTKTGPLRGRIGSLQRIVPWSWSDR